MPGSPAAPALRPPPEGVATVHLGLLMGPHATEIALLRAEIRRRDRDVDRLRSALSQVLGRFAELALRHDPPPPPGVTVPAPAPRDPPPGLAGSGPGHDAAPPDETVPPDGPTPDEDDPKPGDPLAGDAPPTDDNGDADDPRRGDRPDDPGTPSGRLATPTEIEVAAAGASCRRAGPTPLITVVLTTSDWPESLAAAVDSVLSQAYPSWELLVIDDRRPVAPPPLVAPGDGRVRILPGPGRSEVDARRRGLEAGSGQLVAYLGDRTLMAPGWLAALAWAASDSPEVDVFVGLDLTVLGAPVTDPTVDLDRLCREGRIRLRPEDRGDDPTALAHRRELSLAALDGERDAGRRARTAEHRRRLGVRRLPDPATLHGPGPMGEPLATSADGAPLPPGPLPAKALVRG